MLHIIFGDTLTSLLKERLYTHILLYSKISEIHSNHLHANLFVAMKMCAGAQHI